MPLWGQIELAAYPSNSTHTGIPMSLLCLGELGGRWRDTLPSQGSKPTRVKRDLESVST